ncbi:MAG: superoxide dismutase family protein [Pseudomonadota bacterium]
MSNAQRFIRPIALTAGLLAGIAVLAQGPFSASAQIKTDEQFRADVIDREGKNTGSVVVQQTPSGVVLLTVSVTGLTQGWHGIHIHETGRCDPEDGFKSAGGHLAEGKDHGLMSENGPHPGDMPNQMVQEGGVMVAEVFTLLTNAKEQLMDADGSAFIIHSNRDDYTSQPAGNAGERVACGVFKRPE